MQNIDDKLITQRLLFKENQLKKLTGKYLDYITNFSKLDEAECDAQTKDLLIELETLEFQIHKAEMAHFSREKDKTYHMNLYEKIVSSISTTQNQIVELEKELKQREKKKRANLELEVVAENINEYDETGSTESKIKKINIEITDLKDKYQKEIEKLNLKQKQFYQMLSSMNELQDVLLEEEEKEQQANDQMIMEISIVKMDP